MLVSDSRALVLLLVTSLVKHRYFAVEAKKRCARGEGPESNKAINGTLYRQLGYRVASSAQGNRSCLSRKSITQRKSESAHGESDIRHGLVFHRAWELVVISLSDEDRDP